MFFDGTSLGTPSWPCHAPGAMMPKSRANRGSGIYVFAVAVYLTVILSTLRTIVEPASVDTHADRIEAMRVLSAANVIIVFCFGAILALQARSHAVLCCFVGLTGCYRQDKSTQDVLTRGTV